MNRGRYRPESPPPLGDFHCRNPSDVERNILSSELSAWKSWNFPLWAYERLLAQLASKSSRLRGEHQLNDAENPLLSSSATRESNLAPFVNSTLRYVVKLSIPHLSGDLLGAPFRRLLPPTFVYAFLRQECRYDLVY